MYEIANSVAIVGVGYSELSRHSGKTEGYLTLQATMEALRDAGLKTTDLDGVVAVPDRISSTFEGPSITYVQRALGLTRCNFWQAMGRGPAQYSGLIAGAYAIQCGAAHTVLIYRGHLRQQHRYWVRGGIDGSRASDEQAFRFPYGAPAGAPRFALWAQRYLHTYGRDGLDLAQVVLTCREHAQLNPRAIWYGHPLTLEDYLASPFIATPLRILDCDMPIDGAVALILTRADRARDTAKKPVYINSIGHATGPDPDWDTWEDESRPAPFLAAEQMWSRTDLKPDNVDVAELYDGISSLALTWLEALSFCEPGEAGTFLAGGNGRIGGRLPICTDGGQLGGGRLHGFGKLAEAVIQLRGEAGPRQVINASVAVATAGGGPLASATLLTV
jgi:acetyl-CoA acetyltransferase